MAETATTTKWVIDAAHSEISFKVKHLMITNVKGAFKEYEGTIVTNGNDFSTADIDLAINPASIDTKDAQRDGHLKSGDFFDVENHKEITFRSNTIEKTTEGFELWGDLSIKGITNRVKLEVEYAGLAKDPWGNEKAGFTVSGKINRKEWGLNWNAALETGGVLVSDEVKISADIQLLKSKEQ